MSEPAGVLRLGDHVQYDGQSWQVVAVNGARLTLRGPSMQSCAALLTQLVDAPDFALLDARSPAARVLPAALAALDSGELERLRRLEAHIRQIDGTPEFDGTLGGPDAAADPRYDIRTTTVEERVATKVAELAGGDLAFRRTQLFRFLAAYRTEGAVGLLPAQRRRALQGGDGLACRHAR